ncbi:MAG: GTPase [Arcobacteraceae bacterium]
MENMDVQDVLKKIQEELRAFELTEVQVALFGQPGAGKSSLINKLVGAKVAEVGVETDKTTDAKTYKHKGVCFIDLPGYGTENFPKEGYFNRFDILKKDIFLCVTSNKLLASDTEFFNELKKENKICIFVVNKSDELWEEGVSIDELKQRKLKDMKEKLKDETIDVIFTSCKNEQGFDELNEKIYSSLEGAKKSAVIMSMKAYSENFLKAKKELLYDLTNKYAAISAVNGLNPIPGADVAVDVTTLLTLFKTIRESYGLTDTEISKIEKLAPSLAPMANKIIQHGTKHGIIKLLSAYAGKKATQSFSKYIPLVGQAISASIGFTITRLAGTKYIDDCNEIAQQYFECTLNKA